MQVTDDAMPEIPTDAFDVLHAQLDRAKETKTADPANSVAAEVEAYRSIVYFDWCPFDPPFRPLARF